MKFLNAHQIKTLVLAIAAMFFGACLARIQLSFDGGLTLGGAVEAGVVRGILGDFAFAIGLAAICFLFSSVTKVNGKWLYILLAVPLAAYQAGNAIFYRFFGGQLEIWIVSYYWRDIFFSNESVGALGLSILILGSFLFGLLSILFILIPRQLRLIPPESPEPFEISDSSIPVFKRPEFRMGAGGVGVFLLLMLVTTPSSKSAIENPIMRRWFEFAFFRPTWKEGIPPNHLNEYRKFGTKEEFYSKSDRPHWPLVSRFLSKQEDTVELRKELGLPTTGPINVLLVFLESVRGYELWHPEIGPHIFPKLHKILSENGIAFTQAYTSVSSAGMTARGQFSTTCSMLPNFENPSVYMGNWNLNISCIPSLLRDHGYETLWFNTYDKNYHHTREFEELHGTNRFFDQEFFAQEGINKKIGSLGLADQPFLERSWSKIQEISIETGKPVFANLLTISTHHPFTVIPEGRVPEHLKEETAATKKLEYQGYLSRLRYLDDAFSNFFQKFRNGLFSERTVIIAVADHGVSILPHHPLTPIQKREMRFRVPLFVLTKNMQSPRVVEKPVHQIDIVPTIARITDARGQVTWLGRGLFQENSSPWISSIDGNIAYRAKGRACYHFYKGSDSTCLKVPYTDENAARTVGQYFKDRSIPDPLFDSNLETTGFDLETENFFRKLIVNTNLSLNYDWIAPGSRSSKDE